MRALPKAIVINPGLRYSVLHDRGGVSARGEFHSLSTFEMLTGTRTRTCGNIVCSTFSRARSFARPGSFCDLGKCCHSFSRLAAVLLIKRVHPMTSPICHASRRVSSRCLQCRKAAHDDESLRLVPCLNVFSVLDTPPKEKRMVLMCPRLRKNAFCLVLKVSKCTRRKDRSNERIHSQETNPSARHPQ